MEDRSHALGVDWWTNAGVAHVGNEIEVGPVEQVPPGTIVGAGPWAVGNLDGEYFAVSRKCRHLFADLADGRIDERGCLVCPRHASAYNVKTGRMVRGPQGAFAKVPGLDPGYKLFTRLLPLARGEVAERDGVLYVR